MYLIKVRERREIIKAKEGRKMAFDYKEIGLIAGLECHQQLDTGKLFCRCPSILAEHTDKVFQRKLRIVASELNKMDAAMVEQFKKDYLYEYSASNSCDCLIEADEEPVKQADKKALEIILKIALMSNSHIFNELFVMRKIVIDGSNVSGFQRTMLVAQGGQIELKNKKVNIQSIVLEEDAAVPLEKTMEKISYNLQRLGVPLIELATDPELNSPEEVKECALKIGELFRRTCQAKRGLGTIRQDINISIREGARVELKGIQDIDLMDAFVEKEIERQLALIEIKKELEKRNVQEEDLKIEKEKTELSKAGLRIEKIEGIKIKNLNSLLEKCESSIIKNALANKKGIYGIRLKKFAKLLVKNLQGKRRFGTEIANYVKVKNKIPGLFHSDELPNYGITEEEKEKIATELQCRENDAFVLLCESEQKAITGFETILERCRQALHGIPKETRNALEDGCSEYLRPLAGSARMYPETDLESITITKEKLKELKKELPLTVAERETVYKKHGLNEKLTNEMKLDNKACFFEKLLKKGFDATTTAVVLLEDLKRLEREIGENAKKISNKKIEEILETNKKGKLMKDIIYDVLLECAKNPEKSLEEIIKSKSKGNGKGSSSKDVEEKIVEIVKKNIAFIKEKKEHAVSALMGEVMKEFRGKISGKEVNELLLKEIKKMQE